MGDAFRRWLLPGFVFQFVVIAGGYGTGRELVEFFLSRGPVTGLIAMAVATVIWSVVCAISFELARTLGARDSRTFFRGLLGRGWILYEIGYMPFLMIVLAVIAAAAGSILHDTFGLPYGVGVIGMMTAVGILVFYGNRVIERFLFGLGRQVLLERGEQLALSFERSHSIVELRHRRAEALRVELGPLDASHQHREIAGRGWNQRVGVDRRARCRRCLFGVGRPDEAEGEPEAERELHEA